VSKKYKKSPIVEAVCEFQFEEDSHWDSTIPGRVYEKVRSTFPILRQTERVTVSISATPEEFGPKFGTLSLMQFLRKDEKALIQIGTHLLSVNVFKPYPSWQKFLPLIKRGFNTYHDVAAPKGIRRIGLRYINHVEVPNHDIKLDDYFEFRPYVGQGLPQDYGTFALGIQMPYENSRDVLNLQLASLPNQISSSENAAVLLSLDYQILKSGEISLEDAFQWVEVAHRHIEDAFEACITQKLRHLFKEVKE
jgi:uncharacterized protein (TIGR04255 family)